MTTQQMTQKTEGSTSSAPASHSLLKTMALQAYEQSFERALASLATPTIDISVLTSAPQAALLLQGITVLAACVIDASLLNDKTRNAIKLLNSPGSFRASLFQMGAGIGKSFRVADQAMVRIKINLDDMPNIMTSMVTAYAKPEDRGSTFLMNMQMKNFGQIVKLCSEEAEKARQSFDDTLLLIQEMIQVTTATAGDNEEKVGEAKRLLAAYDAEKAALEENKRILQERIEQQRREIEAAKAKYDKAAKKMTNSWTILTATFTDSVGDIFKMFKGFGGTIGKLGRKKRSISDGEEGGIDGGEPVTNGTEGTGDGLTTENPFVEGAAQMGSKISDSAVGNLRAAAELAKEMYKYQRDIEQNLLQQDAANRMALGQIAAKMAATQLDKLNFEEIIYYLSRAVKIIGQVQGHWSVLLNFFSTLESVVIGPLARNLNNFDEIVRMEELRDSGVLRNELASSGFKAAALCVSVSRAAGIYNQISQKYVMPLIDNSAEKLTITKEEAKAELPLLESKMQQITEESHKFLDEKLQEAEKETVAQMMRCRDGFLAALKPKSRLRLR